MSIPSDILSAFIGVQTELSTIFTWNFAHGLPLQRLDLAILWTPCAGGARRDADPTRPTWSWMSWDGSVRYDDVAPLWHYSSDENYEVLSRITFAAPDTLRVEYETTSMSTFSALRPEDFVTPSVLDASETVHAQSDPALPTEHLLFDSQGRGCGILVRYEGAGIYRAV
jgi:hypothetical protein